MTTNPPEGYVPVTVYMPEPQQPPAPRIGDVTGLTDALNQLKEAIDKAGRQVGALAERVATLEQPPAPAPEPEPEPEPEPAGMAVYTSASPEVMGGSSYVQAWRNHHDRDDFPTGAQTWANALYAYWPGDVGAFTADWSALVTDHPDGVPVLASPKGRPDTAAGADKVRTFCAKLPAAWAPQVTWAYWQEPGNDFGGSGQPSIAEYRTRVAALADVVRPYGCENAVHVEEWDINPYNNVSGTTEAQRFAHLGQFVQGIEDKVDVASWSLYPAEGKSMVPGLQRIEKWMDAHLPGVPWMVTATSSPVAVGRPLDAPQRATRAAIVREAGEHIRSRHIATGGRCRLAFGWFHFSAFGGNNKDNLATTDAQLHDALDHVAALTH